MGSVKPPIRPWSRTSIGGKGTLPPRSSTARAVASTSGEWKYTDQVGLACSSVTVIAPATVRPFRVYVP